MIPIYQQPEANDNQEGHAGLWFDRFFGYSNANWEVQDTTKSTFLRRLKQLHPLAGNSEQLEQHAKRQCNLVHALGGQALAMRAEWHFASGLGNPHPLENGLIWHQTLATPYLPGCAVKGLARAWLEQHDYAPELRRRIFGTSHKAPDGSAFDTGDIIFFDALPLKRVELVVDVMTPHMGDWYAKGDSEPCTRSTLPADWHDPVPVSFLACKHISLLFSLAPRTPAGAELLGTARAALEAALAHLGAGAKTATGYGAFKDDKDGQGLLNNWLAEHRHNNLSEEQRQLDQFSAKAKDPQLAGPSNGAEFHRELETALRDSTGWPLAERQALLELAREVFTKNSSKKQEKARKALLREIQEQMNA